MGTNIDEMKRRLDEMKRRQKELVDDFIERIESRNIFEKVSGVILLFLSVTLLTAGNLKILVTTPATFELVFLLSWCSAMGVLSFFLGIEFLNWWNYLWRFKDE